MEALSKVGLEFVTNIIEQEISATIKKLKMDNNKESLAALVSQINFLRTSQKLLNKCFEYKVSTGAMWHVIPEPQHQFSEYRLLEDFDTDNQKDWKEVPVIRLGGGSILIG